MGAKPWWRSTVAFTWAKLNCVVVGLTFCERNFIIGMGYWTRANAGNCLFAIIGTSACLLMAVRRLIVAPC